MIHAKPHFIGMLVHVTGTLPRDNGSLTVYYNSIDGKDDTRESFWSASKADPALHFLSQLEPGHDYAVKIKITNGKMEFKLAREISTVKILNLPPPSNHKLG